MNLKRRRLLRIGAFGSLALAGSAVYVALTPPERPAPFDEPLPDPNRSTPLPAITLPGLPGAPGFATQEVAAGGRPVLINVFASWCAPCVIEAPVLNALHRDGVTIWGIGFRDRPEAISAFLDRFGNPFSRIGLDPSGQLTGPLTLSGVPESLLVDGTGTVRWRWPAGITEAMARETVLPRWQAMAAAATGHAAPRG
jgi:cytochrome c biogenesis protein CcmG/thiol:disulfide interchange protein DsbE